MGLGGRKRKTIEGSPIAISKEANLGVSVRDSILES